MGRAFSDDLRTRIGAADEHVVFLPMLVFGAALGEKAGAAVEKKSLHASERETEANRLKCQQFIERIPATPPEHLIFLDESGVTTSMTRLRGRCLGGQR